jgi:hypothetical protein
VARCQFLNNQTTGGNRYGGGVYINSPVADGVAPPWISLDRCVFAGNAAYYGGALHAGYDGSRSSVTIWTNCLVYSNTATQFAINTGQGTLRGTYRIDMAHCTVADNTGGGIYGQVHSYAFPLPSGSVRIRDSILVNNGAYGVDYDTNGQAVAQSVMEFNDVFGHTTSNYYRGVSAGVGSISADPRFIAPPSDYHLTWLSGSKSPCANAGTNLGVTVDLEGTPRPNGTRDAFVDMGCYEALPPPPGAIFLVR